MQIEIRVKGDTFKPEDNLLLSQAFHLVSTHCREPVQIAVEHGYRVVRAQVDVDAFEAEFAQLPEAKRESYCKSYVFVWPRNCY